MKFIVTVVFGLSFAGGLRAADSSGITDTISFGNAASEDSHHFSGDHSRVITGNLGEPARTLSPLSAGAWEGGRLAFTLKVDPNKQNYATVRLSGSDATDEQLVLFCEGKQVGYRHLGDIDILDIGGGEAPFPGRFIYNTTPLPLEMTKGKTGLRFEIRSYGSTWPYGNTFDRFQRPMTGPTRGIYKLYTHTDGYFEPPAGEKVGNPPVNPPIRQTPGPEVLDQLKERVNHEVDNLLKSTRPLDEMQMQFLARAYFVAWTPAYRNSNAVTQVSKGLDGLFAAWRENPALAHNDPSTPNPGWFEFGPAGEAIWLLAEPLKPFFDESIDNQGKVISRRAAYSEMLRAGRDWHRQHRRLYSNQTMINDLYGIYLSNRGLEIIDPTNAMSEPAVRRYLYESVGLEPWRDSDPGGEDSSGRRNWGIATNYFELTQKGLTRELGYVGYYGEVLDWVTSIYEATRPAGSAGIPAGKMPALPGDEKIKAQLEKIIHARASFRYPGVDADGNQAMRIEGVVGWRDPGHYPGDVCYAERPTWDASVLYAAAATLDPETLGYVQQMFADGQFFASIQHQMAQNNSLRVTAGLLGVPDQYELIKSQPPTPNTFSGLPMTSGRPDFVFSDEEDGVIAVKNGDEIFYASLYWRARNAVNFLARIHYTTPRVDRIAIVQEDAEFEPSGELFTRPDYINFGFANGGPRYPQELHSASAGEKLPIARIPDGVRFRPGDESVYAGKARFYTLRYGNYLVGMNMTTNKTFELKPPAGVAEARELVSGKMVKLDAPLKVAPRSTLVLWLGGK